MRTQMVEQIHKEVEQVSWPRHWTRRPCHVKAVVHNTRWLDGSQAIATT
jgi:hypothetical protein